MTKALPWVDGWPMKPLTKLDHPVCDYTMACAICMQRCYDGWPGHFFNHPEAKCPCDCGRFPDGETAQKEWAAQEEAKNAETIFTAMKEVLEREFERWEAIIRKALS